MTKERDDTLGEKVAKGYKPTKVDTAIHNAENNQ